MPSGQDSVPGEQHAEELKKELVFRMIDIAKLSSRFECRILQAEDAEKILDLCRKNPLFYEFTEARPDREQILEDMTLTPPGIELSSKYYFGFF